MRFGKRRDKEETGGDAAVDAPPAPESGTADWLAPDHGDESPADHSTPPPDLSAPATPEPIVDPEPEIHEAEPVVEGEAVELPYEPPVAESRAAAPEPEPAYQPPAPEPIPAYQPPAPHHFEPDPAPRLADSISHHEPGIAPGSKGGAWPEPAFDLAERPEILVGAAFGGGLLLALIIRRLGH
jgi:hypothetical protein